MSHRIKMLLAVVLVAAISFTAGCVIPFPSFPTPTSTTVAPGVSLSAIDRAWDIIQQDYVDKSKIDNVKMSGAAIKAMLDTLNDPYTAYMDPETYRLSLAGMEGKFDGIGATVTRGRQGEGCLGHHRLTGREGGRKTGRYHSGYRRTFNRRNDLTEIIIHVRGPRARPLNSSSSTRARRHRSSSTSSGRKSKSSPSL